MLLTKRPGSELTEKRAEWLDEYLRELTTFPSGKHDDQTDSTSQALDWIKGRFFTFPLFEYYRAKRPSLACRSIPPDSFCGKSMKPIMWLFMKPPVRKSAGTGGTG